MIRATGILHKTGQTYFIRPLESTLSDLAASIGLQKEVLSLLDKNQTLIHPQSVRGFAERRDGVHAVTLGVFLGKETDERPLLIAQQTLRLTVDPDIPLVKEFQKRRSELGCTEGFLVHPDFRGNRLTDILLHETHKMALTDYQKTGFVSCVDAHNPYSYNVLLQNGYGLTHAYIDPSDEGKTYAFLYHPQAKHVRRCHVNEVCSGRFSEVRNILHHTLNPLMILMKERENVYA